MRWGTRGFVAGILIAALGSGLAATSVGFEFEKEIGLPWFFTLRGVVVPPPEVAIVAIDSSTGKALKLPQMPREWPRSTHGALVDRLVDAGASVVVFDFDFSRGKSEEDYAFANAVAKADRVVLLEALSGRRQPLKLGDGAAGSVWIEETLPPTPALAQAAKGIGPFPLPKRKAAVFDFWSFKASVRDAPTTAAIALQLHALSIYDRWVQMLQALAIPGTERIPRSANGMAKAADVRQSMMLLRGLLADKNPAQIVQFAENLDGFDPAERKAFAALTALYTGSDNRYLNFYGPPGTIPTLPYQALVDPASAATPIDLTNKVVFVGYSDLFNPDQPDRFYTVFTRDDGIDLSGVEIMATAFANLLTNQSLRASDAAMTFTIVSSFGFAVGLTCFVLSSTIAVPLTLLLSIAYAAVAQWAFNESALWLPLATPMLVQLPLGLLLGLMSQYLIGRRRQLRMSRAIGYYLPESLVKDLTEREVDPGSVNRIVYGTCLATDMSGFTSIAETMPPDQLAGFMNTYFDAMARTLRNHAVDVTEFHADSIMCAWTGESRKLAVRRSAVLAAIDAAAEIQRFGDEHSPRKLSPRIGLQDGLFYLGHTGGGGRFTFSILGDAANTASRLEALNKHLGTRILAAESVTEGIDGILIRPLGSFSLFGRHEATRVVEILARADDADFNQIELCARSCDALEAVAAERWEHAAMLWAAILERYPEDGPSLLYLKRCRQFAEGGPPRESAAVIQMDRK
jgi:adenylate cyclase